MVNYVMNNNHILSKLFDVYNTIEKGFKRDSGSLGTMTNVVKGESQMKKIKLTPREQTFFMKGWTLEGVFARNVLQVSRTHLSKVL